MILAAIASALIASRAPCQVPPTKDVPSSPNERAAEGLFRVGDAAYSKHDYRAAAQAYEEAYRQAPRGAASYSAGLAWDAAGERGRAFDAFVLALGTSDLEPRLRTAAMERKE